MHLRRKSVSVTVPPSLTDAWKERLNILVKEVLPQVRSEGNLLLPVSYQEEQGVFHVNTMAFPEHTVDLKTLSDEDRLIVLRSVCTLLSRLHAAGYMLGKDLRDAVVCYPRKERVSAALCLLPPPKAGRDARLLGFCTQEKDAALKPSPEDTPEAVRRKKPGIYGTASAPEGREDVFSVALMFAEAYTGKTLKDQAAQDPCDLVPQAMLPVYGPLDTFLRMGLVGQTALRPTMQDWMDMLSMLRAEDVGRFSPSGKLPEDPLRIQGPLSKDHAFHQRFAVDRQGKPYALVFLDNLHLGPRDSGQNPAWREAMEQRIRTTERTLRCAAGWSKRCRAFLAYDRLSLCHTDAVTAELPVGPLVALSKIRKLQRSLFLLDMRMVDLLLAVQVVHDDGAVFGAMGEHLFAYRPSDTEMPLQVLDISPVFFLDDPPDWPYLRITEQALKALSPEMHLAGCGHPVPDGVGTASDIFSLGVLYHVLLTGKYPVPQKGTTAGHAVSFSMKTDAAVALSRGLDSQHRDLILRMLSFLPSDRPDSCREIAEEILSFYTG